MSEMIERVAKAMFMATEEDFSCWQNNGYMDIFRERARVAIEAMREPTKEMVASCPHEDAGFVWRDMIAVARGETVLID